MDKKIKVVQLITTMADGGAETLVKDYAILCDKEKFDMKIVTWSEPLGSANERQLAQNGISVIHLGEANVVSPTSNPVIKAFRRIKKYYDFRKLIVTEKIDVIHIHLRFGYYLKCLPHRVLKNIKLFYTVHNEPGRYFEPDGKGKKLFEYKEAKRLINNYDMLMIALHDDMNQEVKALFDTSNVLTVNNGINFDRFNKNLYDVSSVRKMLGISEDSKVIGHVGSYTNQKNHELLINVFEQYLKSNKKAVLLLIGKGVLKQQIIELVHTKNIDNSVIFLENRDDVPSLMSIMDVFVLPSRWEGFPVVMIEAQKMGLRCVISDKINRDVILSDKVTMLDINAPIEQWIDAIDDKCSYEEAVNDFEAYDINSSINRLQELYAK